MFCWFFLYHRFATSDSATNKCLSYAGGLCNDFLGDFCTIFRDFLDGFNTVLEDLGDVF